MNAVRLFRYLDWPRFLRAFFVVDVANLVVLVGDPFCRLGGTPGSAAALDEIRDLSTAARFEMELLVEEASERAG